MLILMMIEDMMADLGCDSVTAAATVDQALALIDAEIFDVAMLDMNLNGNKTHYVADALIARGVPFVFSTGYSGHNMGDAYRDRPVLTKPFMNEATGRGADTPSRSQLNRKHVIWPRGADPGTEPAGAN